MRATAALTVFGEPGIGKTRLATEATLLRRRAWSWATAMSTAATRRTPLREVVTAVGAGRLKACMPTWRTSPRPSACDLYRSRAGRGGDARPGPGDGVGRAATAREAGPRTAGRPPARGRALGTARAARPRRARRRRGPRAHPRRVSRSPRPDRRPPDWAAGMRRACSCRAAADEAARSAGRVVEGKGLERRTRAHRRRGGGQPTVPRAAPGCGARRIARRRRTPSRPSSRPGSTGFPGRSGRCSTRRLVCGATLSVGAGELAGRDVRRSSTSSCAAISCGGASVRRGDAGVRAPPSSTTPRTAA